MNKLSLVWTDANGSIGLFETQREVCSSVNERFVSSIRHE
jgi:hypothetical protein